MVCIEDRAGYVRSQVNLKKYPGNRTQVYVLDSDFEKYVALNRKLGINSRYGKQKGNKFPQPEAYPQKKDDYPDTNWPWPGSEDSPPQNGSMTKERSYDDSDDPHNNPPKEPILAEFFAKSKLCEMIK